MQVNAIDVNNPPAEEPLKRRQELPFTLQELKAAIPAYCFEPSTIKSLSYLFLDVAIVAGLYVIAHALDSWFFWPIFWLMQGTMFWALFVVGHDCGHRSFSRYKWLNDFIGHLTHTPILVPFHSWRISHRTHHKNTANIDTDESWHPISESDYRDLPWYVRIARYNLVLLLYPIYLFQNSRGKRGSHFDPNCALFKPWEKAEVITSTVCCISMVVLLGAMTYQWGLMWLLKYYLGPYVVFVMWLDLVTYLHHTVPEIPWYRGKDWYFLKGALSTIDHDYGFINNIHHNIGTHVAHHIFLNMPHYHLKAATEAIKPILGDYYRKSDRSIWEDFWRSTATCHFIPDAGTPVYYQATTKTEEK